MITSPVAVCRVLAVAATPSPRLLYVTIALLRRGPAELAAGLSGLPIPPTGLASGRHQPLTVDGSLVNDEAISTSHTPSNLAPGRCSSRRAPKQARRSCDRADDQDHLIDPAHRRRAGQVPATVAAIVKVLAAAQIEYAGDASAVNDANDSSSKTITLR
jgi:hypothetical protein